MMFGGVRRKTAYSLTITILLIGVLITTVKIQPVKASEPGLIGYWKFDEGSGTTAYDSSGNNNTGTLVNGPAWVDGKIGKALSFDGIDDYVEVPDSNSLDLITSLTLTMWLKPAINISSDNPWYYTLLIKWHGAGDQWRTGYAIQLKEAARIVFLRGHGGGEWSQLFGAEHTWNAGEWYHIAVTYDTSLSSGNGKIYVNGVLDAQDNETRPLAINTLSLFINNDPYESSWHPLVKFFPGVIDDVRVYNRALSGDEIRALSRPDLFQYIYQIFSKIEKEGEYYGISGYLAREELEPNKARLFGGVKFGNPFTGEPIDICTILDIVAGDATSRLSVEIHDILGAKRVSGHFEVEAKIFEYGSCVATGELSIGFDAQGHMIADQSSIKLTDKISGGWLRLGASGDWKWMNHKITIGFGIKFSPTYTHKINGSIVYGNSSTPRFTAEIAGNLTTPEKLPAVEIVTSLTESINATDPSMIIFNGTSQRETIGDVGVGGYVIPVDKIGLLAPYIGLASTTVIAITATTIYIKRFKNKKQKQ
ncbi:MAG: LamG domain-containing protein [Candidatus Bathyarchaeia archaeon]